MLERLQELEDRYISRVAQARLKAVRGGGMRRRSSADWTLLDSASSLLYAVMSATFEKLVKAPIADAPRYRPYTVAARRELEDRDSDQAAHRCREFS